MRRYTVTISQAILALKELYKVKPDLIRAFTDEIRTRPGHLWVTGVGKSGDVARLFSGTLASIGFQVSPIELGNFTHGDAGRIVPGEAVLFISKSGNTKELEPALDLCRATGIHTIGLYIETGKPQSGALFKQKCNSVYGLPECSEADPFDLIPTSSVILFQTFLNGIAMELADLVLHTKEQFQAIHTGGTIGEGRNNAEKGDS